MSVDWTKPIQTRAGLKAEFVREVDGECWVVIKGECGRESMWKSRLDGRVCRAPELDHPGDIVNVPEEVVECVINLYDGKYYTDHRNRSLADSRSREVRDRTHVVTIKRCGDEVTATVEKVQ